MPTIGLHAAHELYSPGTLLEHMERAARAGFTAGSCSDHFHPWTSQGHSGFAWSWLGAALARTKMTFGTVCAPGQRYHPAIIAQASATLAEMFPERFWLAVGVGEAVNEHITGAPWPNKAYRRARLLESVFAMRALWAGEQVTHYGRVTIDRAQLKSLPKQPPLLIGAAISEEAAEWVGGWADGLITVGKEPKQLAKTVRAFREGGGEHKPMFLQSALSFARSEREAVEAAAHHWPICALDPEVLETLETPQAFDTCVARVSPEDVREKLRISADISQHIDWLMADFELGFSGVYLHHVGPDMRRFIDVFAADVLPHFQSPLGASRST